LSGRHVALLRGINVGRAKRVAMSDLRALVEGLGYGDARTLLNSGNVVFSVPRGAKGDPAARIEKAIGADLGVSCRVTVLTFAELDAVVSGNPLLGIARDPSRLLAAVLYDKAGRKKLAPLLRQDWAPDVMAVSGRTAYLWCAGGILASRLVTEVGRTLGDGVTTRNWATILKIHAAAASG
jgi:uncharacterized protein (DUF1697 family)